MKKNAIRDILILIVMLAIDRITKYLAVFYLKGQPGVTLIPLKNNEKDLVKLLYCENTGSAFSMLEGKQVFLLIITVVALIAIVWLYLKLPATKQYNLWRITLAFLTAGAAGNMIDRIRYSYVVDFIYFEVIDFAIFNWADICITCSVPILIILICKSDFDDKKEIKTIEDEE